MKLPPFAWLQCYSRCISYIVVITTVVLNRLLSPTGLRKNTSMPLTTSPPHPHRPTGVPPIPKHLVIQTLHPHRSTHSTTHKRQGHQPCESTGQAASAQPLPTATVSSSAPFDLPSSSFFCLLQVDEALHLPGTPDTLAT